MTHVMIDIETPNRHALVLTFLELAEMWFDDPKHILYNSDSLVEAYLLAWMRFGGHFPETWNDPRLVLVKIVFQEYVRNNSPMMMIYNN